MFGKYLSIESILQNYDEYAALKSIQEVNLNDEEAIKEFKEKHYLSDEDFDNIKNIKLPTLRDIKDYKSIYNDITQWLRIQKIQNQIDNSTINCNDVLFEVDLLKSKDVNLDYILELIFEQNKTTNDKNTLLEDIRKLIRYSLGSRAKESLITNFIEQTNLNNILDKVTIIEEFFKFSKKEQLKEANQLIQEENVKEEETKRYILYSLKKGFASEN